MLITMTTPLPKGKHKGVTIQELGYITTKW